MKSKIKFLASFLFLANLSFAQTASNDLAIAMTPKTDSTYWSSENTRDEKPIAGVAARHSELVVSGIQRHLAQSLDYTDLMVTNGLEGEVVVEIRVSKTGEITPTIMKSLSGKLDEAVLAAINIMPRFEFSATGYQGAKRFYVPVKFSLQ